MTNLSDALPYLPIWKDAKHSLSFSAFCEVLDGAPLFANEEDAAPIDASLSPQAFFNPSRTYPELQVLGNPGLSGDRQAARLLAYLAYLVLELREDPATFLSRIGGLSLPHGTPIDLLYVGASQMRVDATFRYLHQFLLSNMCLSHPWHSSKDLVLFQNVPLRLHLTTSYNALYQGNNVLGYVIEDCDFFEETPGGHAGTLRSVLRMNAQVRFRSLAMGIGIHFNRPKETVL